MPPRNREITFPDNTDDTREAVNTDAPASTQRTKRGRVEKAEKPKVDPLLSILNSARDQIGIEGLARSILNYMLRNHELTFSPEMFVNDPASSAALGMQFPLSSIVSALELMRLRFSREHSLPIHLRFLYQKNKDATSALRGVILTFTENSHVWEAPDGLAAANARRVDNARLNAFFEHGDAPRNSLTKKRSVSLAEISSERAAMRRRLQEASHIAGHGPAKFDHEDEM